MSNLPPGCSVRDIEWAYGGPEGPCQICGNGIDDCKCPECPVCGSVGDPKCYAEHGMVKPAPVKTMYQCPLCSSLHDSKDAAEYCAGAGLAEPRFAIGETAYIRTKTSEAPGRPYAARTVMEAVQDGHSWGYCLDRPVETQNGLCYGLWSPYGTSGKYKGPLPERCLLKLGDHVDPENDQSPVLGVGMVTPEPTLAVRICSGCGWVDGCDGIALEPWGLCPTCDVGAWVDDRMAKGLPV